MVQMRRRNDYLASAGSSSIATLRVTLDPLHYL